ncbi:MAG: response regulator, partial [Firmicutes bacterium]|nr:response regulator [Bacillota bacterium]
MPEIRVLIADEAAVREDIKRLLYFEQDVSVVGEASGGDEAVQLAERLRPDVVLLEIDLPGTDGLTAAAEIAERFPEIGIIVGSTRTELEYLRRAMAAGAREYLNKPYSSGGLAEAIRRVYRLTARRAGGPGAAAVAAAPPRPAGKLVALFSAKDGVGRTTIACNLAVSLAREARRKVALVDLDLFGGDV